MKRIKLLSILVSVLTIIAAMLSFFNLENDYKYNSLKSLSEELHQESIRNMKDLNLEYYKMIKTQSAQLSDKQDFKVQTFYVKVIFSFIFCFASLYIILSKKYDAHDEKIKWAFGTLTLIAGIWIGTFSS